jgi:hypothetical protein
MTGTSTSTPTTVASAAPDWNPNRTIAVATANSKKLLAPIKADGPATHHATPRRRFNQVGQTRVEIDLHNDRDREQHNHKRLLHDLLASKSEEQDQRQQ